MRPSLLLENVPSPIGVSIVQFKRKQIIRLHMNRCTQARWPLRMNNGRGEALPGGLADVQAGDAVELPDVESKDRVVICESGRGDKKVVGSYSLPRPT